MRMNPTSEPAALLTADQVDAVTADLNASLGLHPEWPDLWNLRGLVDTHQGSLDTARASFEEAVRRSEVYAAAQANLAWVSALISTAATDTETPSPTAQNAPASRIDKRAEVTLRVVTALAAGETPADGWANSDSALSFLALLLSGDSADPEEIEAARSTLERTMPGAEELLTAAGLKKNGQWVSSALQGLGHPQRLNSNFSDLLLRCARLEGIAGHEGEEERLQAMAALYLGDRGLFLVERGEAASRQGHPDEALRLLRASVEVRPEWHRSHQALGYELSIRGLQAEALHHLEQATQIEPRYADVLYQYGLLLHAAGRNTEAIAAMGRALAQNPSYLVARIALANLLFETNRPAEAAPHYEHALEEGMETATLIGRFGYSLHAGGHRDRAEELFLDAIARHRDRPELLALYGQFLTETDRKIEARAVWKQALEADPPNWIRAEIETMLEESPVDPRSDRS